MQGSGRVVLVTGGASGIGAATVKKLVATGVQVTAVDTNADGLDGLNRIGGADGQLLTVTCDVTNEEQVQGAIDASMARFGSLDGLVTAAGSVVVGRFLEFDTATWERTFRVNVLGTYLTIQQAAPHLKASGRGRIVNFSSVAGKIPNPFTAPYAASKAAVISLTKSAAVALGPTVNVNCVCPGIIDTPMWDYLEKEFQRIGAPIDFRSRAEEAPIARPGTPDDVADVVLFLLGDESRFMTGQAINVSGGLVMH